MARNRGGGKCFAAGVLLGGIFGGLTALLFAPKNGEKMRKEIYDKYQRCSEKTCELFDQVCDQTSELVDKAKDVACSAKEAAKRMCRRD